MKILLSSHFFHPSVGGIEEVSYLLAGAFTVAGHQVRVLTGTTDDNGAVFPFSVIRRPSPWELLQTVVWSDIVFQNNVSLRMAWPLLVVRRPWVVAHQTWISRPDGEVTWRDHFKRQILRCASNIAISRSVAKELSVSSTIIENPYQADVFRSTAVVQRTKALVFVGRLVSDKGADVLLAALAILKLKGLRPGLTVVGSGPEETHLRGLVRSLDIADQVEFVGIRKGGELAQLLNQHRILVVPSRWREPFGIVALEGIACGCFVIGSELGGLKDAIGPCGVTFPNGDIAALAACLAVALHSEDGGASYQRHAAAHLAKHCPVAVARAYLEVFAAARCGGARR